MNARIENGTLIIEIKTQEPMRPSKSGKTLIVATTGGNQKTTLEIDGRPVTIGLNAYISRD